MSTHPSLLRAVTSQMAKARRDMERRRMRYSRRWRPRLARSFRETEISVGVCFRGSERAGEGGDGRDVSAGGLLASLISISRATATGERRAFLSLAVAQRR